MQGRCLGSLVPWLGLVGVVMVGVAGCQGQVSYAILRDPSTPARANEVHARAHTNSGQARAHHGEVLAASHEAEDSSPPRAKEQPRGDTPDTVALARIALQTCEAPTMRGPTPDAPLVETPLPRELWKESLPPYIIEPPDTLVIEAIRMVPLPPYRVEPLDVVVIQVAETLPNQPISGNYAVGPDGTVNLGYSYGVVRVAGLTLEQAAAAIRDQLGRVLKTPQVGVALAQFRGMQQVRGEHLVGMDGTINLGSYGCVYITGLTVAQAKVAVEKHLSRFLLNPEISLAVSGYNSKVYYVITDGAGFGEQVFRFPVTGNETVLDALSNINGIPPAGSKRNIWLARPAPANKGCYQVLPVDWEIITQAGSTETNFQIFPGDRIYVKADKLIHFDNWLAKIISPIERIFGVTLLGQTTIRSFERGGNGVAFFPF